MAFDNSAALLAQILGGISTDPNAGQPQGGSDPNNILINSNLIRNGTSGGAPGPSVVSRIFDLLSRPNYAVASFIKPILDNAAQGDFKDAINNVVPWNAYPHVWQGLSGQTKNTFTDIAMHDTKAQPLLDSIGTGLFGAGQIQPNSWTRALTGLALDIGTDPTSYIGPGAIKGVLKGAGILKGSKGLLEAGSAAQIAADAAAAPTKAAAAANDYLHTAQLATAAKAAEDAPKMTTALDAATQAATQSIATQAPTVSAAVLKSIPPDMRASLSAAGVAPAGVAATSDIYQGILKAAQPAQQAMTSTSSIAGQMMNPIGSLVPAKLVIKRQALIDKAIAAHMDSPYREVATQIGDGNKAVDFLNQRFNAAYGYSDLRPMLQDSLLSAQSNAQRQAKIWSDVVKATTKQQRVEAWAQFQNLGNPGALMPHGDPAVMSLAQQMADHVNELFDRTGIKGVASSVATRSAFTLKDINKELARTGSTFKFINGKVDDPLLGRGILNYKASAANPTAWMRSIESYELAKGEDPVEVLNKLDIATEKLAKKYALMDEIGARFGKTEQDGPFKYLAADPRFAGRYFPKETVVQINKMMEELNSVKYMGTNTFFKQMDRINSAWKSGVTIYSPSHHARNFIGDSWLSWVAGVNSPIPYVKAVKAMAANHDQYKDWSTVGNLIAPDAMAKAAEAGGRTLLTTRSGVPLTAKQVYVAAHQRGLLIPARALEDIYAPPLMDKWWKGRITGGRAQDIAQGTSQLHEHFTRLAHFIDAIQKAPRGMDVKTALDNAAHEVRKWHPDGMDLTGFEQQYMRRIAPFYSWTRKAFPLVWEAMLQKPGKVNAYAKAQYALQNANGIQGISRADPFPQDQLFPSWMQDKGIGPVGASGMSGLAGLLGNNVRQGVDKRGNTQGGYAFANPSNPMIDLISQFFGAGNPRAPAQGAGSMLNPLLRIPIELTTNRQLFSDVPPSYDPNKYVTEQIPGAAILSRLTNIGLLGPTKRGQNEGLGNPEALINYLTGAGVQGSGPYISQAEREAKARLAAQKKAQQAGGGRISVLTPK